MQLTNKLISSLLAILVIGCIELHAQNFEGVIHYETPGIQDTEGGTLEYMVKGSNIRMEMGQQQGGTSPVILFMPEESKMVVVIDQMQAYFQTNTDDQQDQQAYEGKWQNSTMTETGEQKTIAGYECEIWNIENEGGEKLRICMADGLGSFVTPSNPMTQKGAPAWVKKVSDANKMPLEVVEITGGKESTQMIATNIEEKSLDASLFEIPEGYRDMSAMMQQMQNKNKQ